MGIYDYSVPQVSGEELSLADFKGQVILIVNTATGCGYHDKGLEIIDIPCNQFAGQTPGTDEEIHEFCTLHYNTKFPQMKKSDVNGDNALPLYGYLKSQKGFEGFDGPMAQKMDEVLMNFDKDYKNNPNIKWNFTKFVVDRQGNVVARFEPTTDMKKVEECVVSLI